MLEEILSRHPEHPLVMAKLHEVDEIEASRTHRAIPSRNAARAASSSRSPLPAPGVPSLVAPMPDHSARVAQVVDAKDFDTHYDLGIAYKEMGLYNDAIREFELIAEAPGREVLCHEMIGICFSAKGQQSEAISHFKKGLYVENITEIQMVSLYYELGMAYEKLNDPREALYYHEKVIKRDAKFRDVERRVAQLRQQTEGAGAARPGANGGSVPVERGTDLEAALNDVGHEGHDPSRT
jgi:pilus assembly protein FimV